MKKIITTIALFLSIVSASLAEEGKVNAEVLKAFNAKFPTATHVNWITSTNHFKADFHFNGYWISAYYNLSAELLCVTRNISSAQLPLFLQNKLKMEYGNFWITDLFELSKEQGFSYYVTLQGAEYQVMLEAKDGTDWKPVLKIKN